jgi:hypothetical protein
MNSIKCKYCELPNFADAMACKRCGNRLHMYKDKRPRRYSVLSLLTFAGLAVLAYYMFGGFESSMNEINAIEANRIAANGKDSAAGMNRSESDRQRAGQYGGAVRNSNSLAVAQKHNAELQKTMQTAQGAK